MNRSFGMAKLRSLLQLALARRQRTLDGHPDANTLLAFVESSLPRPERRQIANHVAECCTCRDVLALASQAEPATKVWSRRWPRWPLAVAAAIACTLVVGFEVNISRFFLIPEARQDIARVEPVPAAMQAPIQPVLPKKPVAVASQPRARKLLASPKVLIKPTIPPAVSVPPAPEIQQSPSAFSPVFVPSTAQLPGHITVQPNPAYAPSNGFLPQASFARSATLPETMRESAVSSRTIWSIDPSQPGTLIRSDEGGGNWQSVHVPASTIDALSADGPTVWIAGDNAKLYLSSDNGVHWRNIPVSDGKNIPEGAIRAITVRAGRVILKTNSGIWSSPDNGETWTYQSEGN